MSEYEILAEGKKYFRFERRPTVLTGPHFHGAIEFFFAEKCEQSVVVGGEKRVLKVGEGCFSDSFCVHSYEKNDRTPSTFIVGEKWYFERFFTAKGDKVPPKFFRFHNFELLHLLMAICNKNYKNEQDRYAAIEGAMHILLAEIALENDFVLRKADKQSSLVCDVLLYAERHLDGDLSLQALSDKFSFSREHLSRLLHQHLSENWNSYVGRLRARAAHALLQENNALSVLDAAFQCGFESANTFYRAYRKEFGKKPRE